MSYNNKSDKLILGLNSLFFWNGPKFKRVHAQEYLLDMEFGFWIFLKTYLYKQSHGMVVLKYEDKIRKCLLQVVQKI